MDFFKVTNINPKNNSTYIWRVDIKTGKFIDQIYKGKSN